MSCQEVRGFPPSPTTFSGELHHHPHSSTANQTQDNLHHHHPGFTMLHFPPYSQSPSPTPSCTTLSPDSTPPENAQTDSAASKIAAILRRAISDSSSNSFQEALALTIGNSPSPIRRTLSDTTSPAFQEPPATIPTPPRIPKPLLPASSGNPVRRSVSGNNFFNQEAPITSTTTTTPPGALESPVFPAAETYSPSPNGKKRIDAESLIRRQGSPQSPHSSTANQTQDNLHHHHHPSFTMLRFPPFPQSPSPTPICTTLSSDSTPPENAQTDTAASKIAAILRRAVSDSSSNSFQEVLALTLGKSPSPIRRTLSDTTSPAFQEPPATIPTPPRIPEPLLPASSGNPVRRSVSGNNFFNQEEPITSTTTTTTPPGALESPVFPAAETYSPSPNGKKRIDADSLIRQRETPQSKKLKRMEKMAREIKQTFGEFMHEVQESDNGDNPLQEEGEECVGLERLSDDGLRIQMSCSCGQCFEILLKPEGCFYKLI